MEDDLRSKLDAASLLPRGRWKELWKAAATELTAPVAEQVQRVLEDDVDTGTDAAREWLAHPEREIPIASWRAWCRAFETLKADSEHERRHVRELSRVMLQTLKSAPFERALPVFLAAFGPASWKVRTPLLRGRWVDELPFGLAVAVTCVMLEGSGFDRVRSNAFHELSKVKGLASAARGAMWMLVWSDPSNVRWHWQQLASLGEPAAIAAALHDQFYEPARLPMRPALTKALCRVIAREDPWLELKRDADDSMAPKPELIVQRALLLLARVAQETGTEALARETLDSRWTSLGPAGAIARARLGCADAVPALIAALQAPLRPEPTNPDDYEQARLTSPETALEALARLGQSARAALDAVRAARESSARSLALAAIDPTPASLDALLSLVERVIATGVEYRSQYEEGLITNDEYARRFDDAALARELWTQHGWSPARRDAAERLRVHVQAEHSALHEDRVVQRLLVPLS